MTGAGAPAMILWSEFHIKPINPHRGLIAMIRINRHLRSHASAAHPAGTGIPARLSSTSVLLGFFN
jgi:hypothetical protein